MRSARKLALAGGAATLGAAFWWRIHPSACPYSQRFWVEAPHPFITRERLREALEPRPGERLLEVGPGTGYYTLPAAEWIGPSGSLDVLDVQQDGRIVVGELFGDPHVVTRGALAERAEAAGLRVDRVLGGRLWHHTRL